MQKKINNIWIFNWFELKKSWQKIISVKNHFNGTSEYQKYLDHFYKNCKTREKPLTKKDFFIKKQKDKWDKINRCC